MKKLITTVSAMTLTLPSGTSKAAEFQDDIITHDEIKLMYADGDNFRGSGFIDLDVQKSVLLTNDADGSGTVTLGDELRYSVLVNNLENADVPNLIMFDFLESKIELNRGSVAVSQGFVISGNNMNDPTDYLYVDIGTVASNWFALVEFEVTVTQLEPGMNVIENSAEIYGPSGSYFLSDDPATPGFDPTRIDAFGPQPDLIYQNGFEFRGSGGF